MKKILVTGGPVHAYLDAVKIITNRFKGGLIAQLARDLKTQGYNTEMYYVSDQKFRPIALQGFALVHHIEHNGFDDYKKNVLELAPEMDAIILGAAVANLIPVKPFKGKFPSHNYKPGDVIPIDFTIAPRIIDEVKKVAPKTHLFGFM